MKPICTICARGGSKGVPDKNIREMAGRPLIAHTIAQAVASQLFDVIAVSSDSARVREAALEHGATHVVVRPPVHATDSAAKLPAIRHCVETVEAELAGTAEIIVDLDATSPLRTAADIVESVALISSQNAENVITATPARRSPYFNMVELDELGQPHLSKTPAGEVSRRQDAPACYDMNASIYVWRRRALFSDRGLFGEGAAVHIMPEERSHDIDSPLDWRIVELILQSRVD